MADIQSTAAEIGRGKKARTKKKERRKTLQGKNIMAPLLHRAAITRMWANAERDGRPAEYKWRISDVGVLTTASEL